MNDKFTISHPVKPWVINQAFGNPNAWYMQNGVPITKHNGIDLMAYHGQPVYAPHDGYVFWEIDDKGGHGVVIKTDKSFDLNGTQVYYKTILWHFCDWDKEKKYPLVVQQNQYVKRGDLVGYADSTGLSTGDHVHLGLKAIDRVGNTLFKDNEYLGAIDPTPYLNGTFACDPYDPILQAKLDQIEVGVKQAQIGVIKLYISILQNKVMGLIEKLKSK